MHHALKLDASRSGAMMHSQLHANSLFNGILTACVCDADKGAGDAKADGSCEPRQAGPAASCSASAAAAEGIARAATHGCSSAAGLAAA